MGYYILKKPNLVIVKGLNFDFVSKGSIENRSQIGDFLHVNSKQSRAPGAKFSLIT